MMNHNDSTKNKSQQRMIMTIGHSAAASAQAVAHNGTGAIQLNNNDDEMVGDEDEEEGLIFSDSEPPTSH